MKETSYYKELEDNRIKCLLCPHGCEIDVEKSGICRSKVNYGGQLYTKNYGKISSVGIDPIEKKPLYHFYPGSDILSLGTYGCNFNCKFCQNWRISQGKPQMRELNPEEIIELCLKKDVIGIAYTYSEPSVWYEFIYDTAKLAADNQLKNVIVTNGFINQEPLQKILPFLDAANVDLKAFNNEFYRQQCGGQLEPVLKNIEIMNEHIHLELTTLLIEGLNDSETELRELFSWVKKINFDIPFHLSRYFPNYKMDKPETSLERMKWAYKIAKNYLNYVYLGNTDLKMGKDTICPRCEKSVIVRNYFDACNKLEAGSCPYCGFQVLKEH